ncbi:MAG: O-antigen ligase family protein [Desulfuromonadaceae bacterium]|nr:O-antigen ligase family protein [Desulfuromonadaceae bacterium]
MRALLYYICLPLIAVLGLRRPFWGVAIYLSVNIIRPEMLFWGGNTGALIFRVSLGSALLGYFLSQESKTKPLTVRELWLVLWICLAVAASIVFSNLPPAPRAWYYFEEFFKLLLVAWLFLGVVREKQHVLQLANVLLLMAMLLSLWGWDQSFRGNERLEGLGGKAFGDSNGVAAFGAMFLPLALHKIFSSTQRWQKMFGIVGALLIAGMIAMTNSRGGFLGLVAGALYLILISPKKMKLAALYVVALLVATPFISSRYIERVATIEADQGERDYSSASRLVLWRAGWLVFLDNPIFGVGLLNFSVAKAPYRYDLIGKYDEDLLNFSFQPYKVGHSTWFCQMLAEGGLFLALPMLWLIAGFFWQARKLLRTRAPTQETAPLHNTLIGLEAGIFGYCVSISFIDALISPFLTVQLLLGMQCIRIIAGTEDEPKQISLQGVRTR